MIRLAGKLDGYWVIKGSSVGRRCNPLVEIVSQGNVGLYLKSFRLINRVADAVA